MDTASASLSRAGEVLAMETLRWMWVIAKMLWPLWAFLGALLALRLVLDWAVSKRGDHRAAGTSQPQPRRRSGGAPADSLASSLSVLAGLRSQGAITHQEYVDAKRTVMDRSAAHGSVADRIAELHELKKSGALSESEFNSKKWDLLSRG